MIAVCQGHLSRTRCNREYKLPIATSNARRRVAARVGLQKQVVISEIAWLVATSAVPLRMFAKC
jgi:hypothetical protein